MFDPNESVAPDPSSDDANKVDGILAILKNPALVVNPIIFRAAVREIESDGFTEIERIRLQNVLRINEALRRRFDEILNRITLTDRDWSYELRHRLERGDPGWPTKEKP